MLANLYEEAAVDSKHIRRLSGIFSGLDASLTVFDKNGMLIYGSITKTLSAPMQLSKGEMCVIEGVLFMRAENCGAIVMLKDSDSAKDCVKLACALLDSVSGKDSDEYLSLHKLLSGDMPAHELKALISRYRISEKGKRCAILLGVKQNPYGNAAKALKKLIPLEGEDLLIPITAYTVVLVKWLQGETSEEDIADYANAVIETALLEEGIEFTIAIGGIVDNINMVSKSYDEAQKAIQIGAAFLPKQSVYIYDNMYFERLMSEIPPDTALKYHRLIFSLDNMRLFTPDMINTVNTFLENDLNIADTARQLYIHRNTLVYRLDKVQAQTGLDVRRFKDALVFKMLYELKNCAKPE